MTRPATSLRLQMKERGLTQTALSHCAGVAAGSLNDILLRGHVPKVEILLRLAGALDTTSSRAKRRTATRPMAPACPTRLASLFKPRTAWRSN